MNKVKTRGIVLSFIKYKETSIICKIFTQELGLQSYLVQGVRGKKSKIALYQPLNILDLVVTYKSHRNLHRIAEASLGIPYFSIPFEVKKASITLFLTEMLTKAIGEEGENPALYMFLETSLVAFDQLEETYENFHLQFLLKLTKHIGLEVQTADTLFQQLNKHSLHGIDAKGLIDKLIQNNYTQYIPLSGKIRSLLLQHLIHFYRLHIENFGQVKSLSVLKEIF